MNENLVSILKMADTIGIDFVCPIAAILIEIAVKRKRQCKISSKEIIRKWLAFFIMGVAPLVAGLMQGFNPAFTASMLQVPDESFVVIRELGYAAIGTGLIGILSIKFENWRIPVAVSRGTFILLCTLLHIGRMEILNTAEVYALISDAWVVATALFILFGSSDNRVGGRD